MTGCAATSGSGKTEPPAFGAIPAKFKQKCPDPADPPDRDLTKEETEAYWNQDTASLINCSGRQQGLVKFVEDRDRRIGGNK